LAFADVIDDPARPRCKVQIFGVRELTQLADAEKGSLLRRGSRQESTRRDQQKQRSSAECIQTEF
jgi:hypothetical protein